MEFTVELIREARERIRCSIEETPLVRVRGLDAAMGCEVYLKLENMQVTYSFKYRGAMNSVLALNEEERCRGIITASSGNHGRAIAYAAKQLGTTAVVVMPKTSPQAKIDAIRHLGAEVILCETSERFRIAAAESEKRGMTYVPPYNYYNVMAGQGTLGLEVMEQRPDLTHIVVPLSGGGLLSGVAAAVKAVSPQTKVIGAEPAEIPRYTKSLAAGEPVAVAQKPTVADALVSTSPGPLCFPVIQKNVDGVAAVDEEMILKGQKLLLMEGKLLAEPAACIGIGAVLQGTLKFTPADRVCFLITGGKVGFEQIERLRDVSL